MGRQQPRPIDKNCSLGSDSSTSPRRSNGRKARDIHEPRTPCPDNSSVSLVRFCKNAAPTKEDETCRWRSEGRKRQNCSLRSECRSKGSHCCACPLKDVRDSWGSLVDRKHKRVHSRMTGSVPGRRCRSRPTHRPPPRHRPRRPCHQSNFAMLASASGRTGKSPCSSKGAWASMACALLFSTIAQHHLRWGAGADAPESRAHETMPREQ